MIPMPPIHCIKARQKSNPWGNDSKSGIADDPVVVKPAIVSKNASTGLDNVPVMMNGNMPKSEKITQIDAVRIIPSRLRIDDEAGLMPKVMQAPAINVIDAVMKNATVVHSSPYSSATPMGMSMNSASIINSHPSTLKVMGKLIFCVSERDIN